MVEVKGVSKSYAKVKALNELSFSVSEGELFGLIGPDGAGKTTLFRILTTLLLPDSGTASVAGFDVVKEFKRIRERVGYMPGRFSLYQDLSVEENLQVFASLFNADPRENYHLIKPIYDQLLPFKDRKAGALSGGMKQKLALSCALIHKPEVLFLDEPTTGVDPVSREELWEVLTSLKEKGVSILVSTPYMDEAKLCDRIALMQEGNFLSIEKPEQIIAKYVNTLWSIRSDDMYSLLKDLKKESGFDAVYAFGDAHHVSFDPDSLRGKELSVETVKDQLNKLGHQNLSIEVVKPGIEDCFMNLIRTE